ncbi:hypothetical protein DFH27DRAFT_550350 [Peziza echinospora]|nr:hypothetical protein DFH27DRAFT_550350 [Peziza echinospora]
MFSNCRLSTPRPQLHFVYSTSPFDLIYFREVRVLRILFGVFPLVLNLLLASAVCLGPTLSRPMLTLLPSPILSRPALSLGPILNLGPKFSLSFPKLTLPILTLFFIFVRDTRISSSSSTSSTSFGISTASAKPPLGLGMATICLTPVAPLPPLPSRGAGGGPGD